MFWTTAVNKKLGLGESGQSTLELLLFFPFLIGLVIIGYRMNAAVQTSINYQKYARAQLVRLLRNSSVYPRYAVRDEMASERQNQFSVGVSKNLAPGGVSSDEDTETLGEEYLPESEKLFVGKSGSPRINARIDDSNRIVTVPRIRATLTVCAKTFSLGKDSNRPGLFEGTHMANNIGETFQFCAGEVE